jgi:cold shock CspA family protein
MKGFLTSWNKQKGFGFIKGDDNATYFLHKSELTCNNIHKLKKGISLIFESESTDKGMRAINATFSKKLKKEIIIEDNFIVNKHNEPHGNIIFSRGVSAGWQSSKKLKIG